MKPPPRSVVLVDTGVFGANLAPAGQELAFAYRPMLADRRIAISFMTVAELRFGAMAAGWDSRGYSGSTVRSEGSNNLARPDPDRSLRPDYKRL